MKPEKPHFFEEKPVVSEWFIQPDLVSPLFPEDEEDKKFPKKIMGTPKTIHHTPLPSIPLFEH